jgi:hypothetical protein
MSAAMCVRSRVCVSCERAHVSSHVPAHPHIHRPQDLACPFEYASADARAGVPIRVLMLAYELCTFGWMCN